MERNTWVRNGLILQILLLMPWEPVRISGLERDLGMVSLCLNPVLSTEFFLNVWDRVPRWGNIRPVEILLSGSLKADSLIEPISERLKWHWNFRRMWDLKILRKG